MWPFSARRKKQASENPGRFDTPLYPVDDKVTTILSAFANAPDLRIVKKTETKTAVRCYVGSLELWTANEWHAWAMEGVYVSAYGVRYEWERRMPDSKAMLAMSEALRVAAVLHGIVSQPPSVAVRAADPVVDQSPVVPLRDLFAGMAMQGALASVSDKAEWPPYAAAPAFYAWADSLIAARSRAR